MILYLDPQSPYAYLAEARAERVLKEQPTLQPVALGAIFVRRGWGSWAHTDTRPEHVAALTERVTAAGLSPVAWPGDWPAQTLTPARATAWAHMHGATQPFLRAYWSLVFAEGRAAGDITTVEAAAGEAKLDVDALHAGIAEPRLKAALRDRTDAGVRGVPTLAIGDELFFGDDQLEAAAAHQQDDGRMSFDPGEPRQRRFTGYGQAPFPDPRDEELDEFLEGLHKGGPPAVKAAIGRASEQGRSVLSAYADRAAARAVRARDPKLLLLALVAVVVGGLDHNSPDALMSMPLIEDGAQRVGEEFAHLIEDATEVVGHPGSVNLVLWLARDPKDRTLACMGHEAASDESGFRYRYKP